MKEDQIEENSQIKEYEISLNKLKDELKDQSKNIVYLACIFALAGLGFFFFVFYSPSLTQDEKQQLFKFPSKPQDMINIYEIIQKYSKDNQIYVHFAFCYLYIFLQSFGIPGPVFLSILSGAIFGGIKGFFLVCLCASFGASACYGLSYTLARGIVINRFPKKLIWFKRKALEYENSMLWFMLFLRISPIIPNWFVNLASPHVGMKFKYFFFGTLFGFKNFYCYLLFRIDGYFLIEFQFFQPMNIIHIQTGLVLNDMEKIGVNLSSLLFLFLLAFLALIPTMFVKKKELKENKEKQI